MPYGIRLISLKPTTACGKMLITDKTVALIPNASKIKTYFAEITVEEKLLRRIIMAQIHSKEPGTQEGEITSLCGYRALVVPRDQVVPCSQLRFCTNNTLWKHQNCLGRVGLGDSET